jgi:hypothetical protein
MTTQKATMTAHVLKVRCACTAKLCSKALHLVTAGNKNRVLLSISEFDKSIGNVVLDRDAVRALLEWLIDTNRGSEC